MDWRDIDSEVISVLIGGLSVIGFAALAVSLPFAILFVVGETIELFTR